MGDTKQFLQSVLCEIAASASMGAAYKNWSDSFSRKEVREAWEDLSAPLRKKRGRKVSVSELLSVDADDLFGMGFRKWDDELILIPLWVIRYIDPEEQLTSISGDVASAENVDLDVRGGCIAYGFKRVKS